jgi:hypothetical protein
MDYNLFGLNSRSFEQLVQAVATEVLGPGMVVFGDGPDGGREGTMQGPIPYPSKGKSWDGYLVLQAKFRQRSQGTRADGEWLIGQLRRELDAYTPSHAAQTRTRPDYLILASNVTLTAVQDAGTKDQLFELVGDSFLRGFDVWDYDKLRAYLDRFAGIRRAFAAFVSAGDVLSDAMEVLDELKAERPDFEDVVSRFLQREFMAERWAHLEQAGRVAEEQVTVSKVFVDLPVFHERRADAPGENKELLPGFAAEVVQVASRRLDPATLSDKRSLSPLDEQEHRKEGRFVLLGGPGQGKSTICQFICQMFRAAILDSREEALPPPEVGDALGAFRRHLREDGLRLPTARRFPIRVELSELADELADPQGANSLLEYVARLVSRRVGTEVSGATMGRWLSQYPSLIVLDGLDEVPLARSREAIVTSLREFWIDMSQCNADCLAIATSRPQGYTDEFSPRYYHHLWLAPLSTQRALLYSNRLLVARFPDDPEKRSKISGRLSRAAAHPDTARLMTSPLQVTIMATLLDAMGQPPDGRWNLFSRYYRVVYDRELEREIPAASVLREYKPDIDAIHRRVGLLLQVESESERQSEPKISSDRFARIVRDRLRDEEHDVEGNEDLVAQIIMAATDRLVFLVGVESDQVGFEIRSLQEFMAAEALLQGAEEMVEDRLRKIAGLPRWRNVFLFAAGRCFGDQQHLRDTIHTICVELNDPEGEPLAQVALPGSELAIDLLADGVPNRQPRYERLLAREALRALRRPPSELNDRLAEVYRPPLRATYEEEIKAALTVEQFTATLGAWRTLAVLLARSENWPLALLQSRWPGIDDLPELLNALPPGAKSLELARRLGQLCAEAPPEASLLRVDALATLGIADFLPRWLGEFSILSSGKKRSPVGIFRVADGKGIEALEVGSITDTWGPMERILDAVSTDERTGAPASWQGLFSLLDFARSLDHASLAEALEQLGELDEDLLRHFNWGPWPLNGLVAAAVDGDDLRRFAQQARAGEFGGRQAWVTAEQRWKAAGVRKEDIASPDGPVPWDRSIGTRGFPLAGATVQLGAYRRAAADHMLGWLGDASQPQTRRYLFGCLLGWAETMGSEGKSELPLPAAALGRALRDDDLADPPEFSIKALNMLEWNDPLEPEEVELLERLAAGLAHRSWSISSNALRDDLGRAVLEAWKREPKRLGLYQLLAIGWPVQSLMREEDVALVLAERAEGKERAFDLLSLKLAGKIDFGLGEIAAGGGIWLGAALETLVAPGAVELVEQTLASLDSLLPVDRWFEKRLVGALAEEVIAHRSSELMRDEAWARLGLFARPGQ